MRSGRLVFLIPAAAAVAAALVGAASADPGRSTRYGFGAVDTAPKVHLRRGQAPRGFTGGPYTTSAGETVTVYAADEYLAADPGFNQRWADFLSGLLHGPELSTLTLYVAPLARTRQLCGAGALGCYDGEEQTIVALGDDLRGITAQSVVTHEYGHHIASNRKNDPWLAVDWGTKRWASYENVCKRAHDGELVPGDEGDYYQQNPGEVFAETYRVFSERRSGLPESDWEVVDASLYPDDTALIVLEQDVSQPWAGNTTTTFAGRFGTGGTGRGYRVPTAYDGVFQVTLTEPAGTAYTLRVVDPADGTVLAERTGSRRVKTVRASVCGQRTLQVQVKRVSGSGPFTVQISKP